jgi:exosome complex RNA-binding protein Rrp4
MAIRAIKKIEAESHTSGLTDRTAQMIKNEKQEEEKKNE